MKSFSKAHDILKFCVFIILLGVLPSLTAQSATIATCDKEASPCAQKLLLYLQKTATQNKVIFGHQNDTNLSVRKNILSDTEDLTGDISGIVGLDSLELTGLNLGSRNQEEGLNETVRISLEAAQRGALITLSAHMPNFSSSQIKQLGDGSYNFRYCTLADTWNTSVNCAEESLPGGKYNNIFNAYLDMIAKYGIQLQSRNIPVLFRPFHEGNGDWFWWGTGISDDTYKALFCYTKDYLTEKGVHNFLYVYSSGGPITAESEFLKRYPGDEYVDIIAVDYYNGGYYTWPSQYSEDFFISLDNSCKIIDTIATAHGKIPAISETGIWVMKKDNSNMEGLLVEGNPMNDKAWYQKVGEIAQRNHMPYYLVWMNYSDTNFHVPYKNHEMADDFIDFYNEDYSIFAGETHFYELLK